MSANTVIFSNKMVGRNINVEKNDKGWYRVCVGELNAFNHAGEFYVEEGFRELLTETDTYLSVKNRLESGLLKGECTHPLREGHSDQDWLTRNLVIHEGFASHQFMSFELETTDKQVMGDYTVKVWCWILPTANQYGISLKADLDNPDVNVAFSIRCFSKIINYKGRVARRITKIICYDRIDIPGLRNATKGGEIDTITKESGLQEFIISGATLEKMINNTGSFNTENAGLRNDLISLKNSMEDKKDSLFLNWGN